jgi:putative transposase
VVRPKDRRQEALYLVEKYKSTKARCCRLLGLGVSTLSYQEKPNQDGPVRDRLIHLAGENKRFGHPRLFVLLKHEMPEVNHKRSHRIYAELDLQIQRRKRKKLGSYQRLPPTRATEVNQVWAIDFMFDYLETGRRLKVFNIVDEYSKISPGILVSNSIRGEDVTQFLEHVADGVFPKIIRVDQGTEFTSRAMLDWAYRNNIRLEFTKVRKPNQVIEAYNSRVRDECLNEHVFFSLEDARTKIDEWHWRYNNFNPHSALGMKSPIEFAKEREVMLAS